MSERESRSEYESRFHRVLEYIDQHLDQSLDLDTLAQVAHFSPFHFHRLFSAWMGETLGDYLRRRRIEIAAVRLLAQPHTSVLHIALSVGFGSAEAFARAFRLRFDCSPTGWRTQQVAKHANRNLDQAKRKPGQASNSVTPEHELSHNPPESTMKNPLKSSNIIPLKVKLIERQPTTVAYLRHVGPYGETISQFWQTTVYPWMVTNGLLTQPRYGIAHDDPNVTAPEKCRYDAAVEVSPEYVLSGKALKTTIAGGRYASLYFKGTVAEVNDAWMTLFRDWLPSSGLQLDGRPGFEFYPPGSTFDPATGVFECEICIPVVPL